MKTLVIVAHPNIAISRVNKRWLRELQGQNQVTVHELYATYPTGKIDVQKEQELLLQHDRLVFQFPFYWYSTPALLKEWQDVVLTYGWAYGRPYGTKLVGKEFVLAISIGGPEESYQVGGYSNYTTEELTLPLQAMANLTGMKMLQTFKFHGTVRATDSQIDASAKEFLGHILHRNLGAVPLYFKRA
ncbi:NAD(P)H-dependent oxidoreductase [Shimazuella alba]|uniref:General stress protein n=1 Tax=Shimazuella alba TaxID=2690964 RepID=A0A6I4VZ18_9BACL|nr:NAD(P)H-dependent oxidoreductase [Shimazuella alba]MXQ54986.1 general stress protein [Shimazuella alba]